GRAVVADEPGDLAGAPEPDDEPLDAPAEGALQVGCHVDPPRVPLGRGAQDPAVGTGHLTPPVPVGLVEPDLDVVGVHRAASMSVASTFTTWYPWGIILPPIWFTT